MKKTLIALMALAGVACAFDNVELSFEGTLGNGFTWTNLGSNTNSPTYTDSGLVGYGQAIVFDKTGYASLSEGYTEIIAGKHEVQNTNPKEYTPSADADFSVVTTVKFDSWQEYVENTTVEHGFYIFGSGGKWKGLGLRVQENSTTKDNNTTWHNKATLGVTLQGHSHHYVTTSPDLELDTWYTIALTYSASSDTATLYVNGTSVGSITLGNNVSSASDGGLALGNGSVGAATSPWAGQMADFKLFNTALTADQVAAYGAPVAIPEPATATLSLLALAGLCARRRRA